MRPLLIGIAGAHSGAGKTTYACLLLRGLKNWGAIKYTKTALYSSIVDDLRTLSQENKDTQRLIEAGAERTLWVQSPPDEIKDILPMAVERLSDLKGIVVEGNSAIEFLKPDVIIFIFGTDPCRIKQGAKGLLQEADVIVAPEALTNDVAGGAKIFIRSLDDEKLVAFVRRMVETKEKVKTELKERAIDGKLPCPVLRRIAEENGLSYKEAGEAADELEIKIADCELGCF